MNTIVLFDPSIRSLNMGDHVIMQSAENELEEILENNFVIKCATHAPAVTFYQNTSHNPRMKLYDNAKCKIICGSNLLWRNMFVPRPTFNVNWFNCRPYRGSVLMGVGTHHKSQKVNFYTKKLYEKILSKNNIHSVRDDETKTLVESLGYKAINTGCPTMWKFTDEFCAEIPTKKADKVIFTITDYNIDMVQDQKLIDILVENYKEVYFWYQGIFDMEHLNKFKNIEKIKIVPPTLKAYQDVLVNNDIDYVGTRLHAGMFAMQNKKRTIILSIDNRVKSMQETYGLNAIDRNDIENLADMINSDMATKININEENIKKWLAQFK